MKTLTVLFLCSVCLPPLPTNAQSPTPTATPPAYEPYTFSTLAGVPPGSADGSGSAARFSYPQNSAADTSGNIYVADTSNYTVRKITPTGVVTTLAGQAGYSAYVDGEASAARFAFPQGIALDKDGNIYVTDGTSNPAIRKITPGGVVSTVAGGSIPNTTGVTFGNPAGLALDGSGNIYVADSGNSTVCKVTPNGTVTILAGVPNGTGSSNGQGSAARFTNPTGLALDGQGFLYVADTGNNLIRLVNINNGITGTVAGNPNAGSADSPNGQFNAPEGVAVDNIGTLYVADTGNNTIRKIAPPPSRIVSTLAGSASDVPGSADGSGSAARFTHPTGVTIGGSGVLFVTDYLNSTIRRVTQAGAVTTFAGVATRGSADGLGPAARFNTPDAVALDKALNAFVADRANNTIRKVTPAGVVTTVAGRAGYAGTDDGTGTAARFSLPGAIAVNGKSNIYVADSATGNVRKITPSGKVTTLAHVFVFDGLGNEQPSLLLGLAATDADTVFVSDWANHMIFKISPTGSVSLLAGAPEPGSEDGTGAAARFINPDGLALDKDGNLFVADTNNGTIRKITPAGVVTTLTDALGQAVQLRFPRAVAVDAAGNIYTNPLDHTIAKITPLGVVTTLAGERGVNGVVNGTGNAARFSFAPGLAVTGDGRLYVLDGNSVRVGMVPTKAVNISTRMQVGADPNELIAGFILTGRVPKNVIIRALGPSIKVNGQAIPGALQDPTLELHGADGKLIRINDNWKADQQEAVAATGIPPTDERESAIIETLQPGSYTAIVRGAQSSTGIGVVEVYNLNSRIDAEMAQISTRGKVLTGDDAMIGGFILSGSSTVNVLVRAIGPELTGTVAGPLEDPTLSLYDSNGNVIAANDDWRTTQEQAIKDTGVPPTDDREAAIVKGLSAGGYTAIVRGKGTATGVALVEMYVLQ